MPYQAELYDKKLGYKTGTIAEYQLFSILRLEKALRITRVTRGKETVPYLGKKKELRRLDLKMDILSGMTINTWIDDSGEVWIIDFRSAAIKAYKVTEKIAKQNKTHDIISLSLIRPTGRFKRNPQSLMSITLKLKSISGEKINIENNEFQKVEDKGSHILLTTRKKMPSKASSIRFPVKKPVFEAYLTANDLIQSNHVRIRQKARRIIGSGNNAFRAVQKLQRWVFRNIRKKNFSVLYDSALDVLKKMEGDCTEHSVLFTAFCRSVGIPSRLVMGLVYMPAPGGGYFGYHQWSEVWVGEWIAVDPSFGQDIADATHIILIRGFSKLSETKIRNRIIPVTSLIGNLKIEIIASR